MKRSMRRLVSSCALVLILGCSEPGGSGSGTDDHDAASPATTELSDGVAFPTVPANGIVVPTVSTPEGDTLVVPTTASTVPPPTTVPSEVIPSDVLFTPGSATLSKAAEETLLDLARRIADRYPGARLTFLGHTDSRGTDEVNLKLSAERARAVLEVFVSSGFSRDLMRAEGRGESQLLGIDIGPNGRFNESIGKMNRRVEILIQPT